MSVPQTSFYVCGKGFFLDYLQTKRDGINELTKIDLFDFLFDNPQERLIKIEIKGLNMLLLTQSGLIYFTNSVFRFPTLFNFNNQNDDDEIEKRKNFLIHDCSLSTTHALFLTREGIVFSWNLNSVLDDWNCGLVNQRSFGKKCFGDCKIVRVLAFDNGQSFFIGSNKRVFMSESPVDGMPKSIDIGRIQLTDQKAFVYGMDLEESYFKGLKRVRVTNFHEIDQSSESIFLVGQVETYRDNVGSFVLLDLVNGEEILDMSCSNSHTIINTNQRFLAMGENKSGQLGAKHFDKKYYNNLCEMVIPFERESDDQIVMATDDEMTMIAHTRIVKKSKNSINFPSFSYEIGNSCVRVSPEILELVSKDSTRLVKNQQFISSLHEEELELFSKLLEFISFKLFDFNSIENEDYIYLLDEDFTKDMKSIIATLFLLNDISDIGTKIKEEIFSIFMNNLELNNVMESLEQMSNYLTLNILNNSRTSLLMLAVKFCFTFLKKQFKLASVKFKNDPRFQKIISKVQQSKVSNSINWIDPCQCNVSPPVGLINSLYNKGELTFIVDHLGERFVKVHNSVISCSPVLKTLISNMFGDANTQIYDIFDFVRNSQDSEEEMILKTNAIMCVIRSCYFDMDSIKNANFKLLVQIFLTAHQFQIDHILKQCGTELVSRVNKNNFEEILYLASIVEHEEWSVDFLNRLTVKYLRFIEPLKVPIKESDSNFGKKLNEYCKSFRKTAPKFIQPQRVNLDKFHFSRQVFWTACNPCIY